MRLLVLAVAAVIACACGARPESATYSFRPHSVVAEFPPFELPAAEFYEGDIDYLAKAGAVFVGTIEATGTRDMSAAALLMKAASVAANAGGTHIIPATETRSKEVVQWTPDRVDVTRTQSGFVATSQPGLRTEHTRLTAKYFVVRVDPARFAELPPALRPDDARAGRDARACYMFLSSPKGSTILAALDHCDVSRRGKDVVIDADGRITVSHLNSTEDICVSWRLGSERAPERAPLTCALE